MSFYIVTESINPFKTKNKQNYI